MQHKRGDPVGVASLYFNGCLKKFIAVRSTSLKTLDDQRKRKNDLEARKIKRQEDQALYVELRDAFSKKGIPAMIIEAA
ncbi:MAG: hypothetical protein SF123_17030, partial [Chloroflexota bacterium]|nr:hypothetical protein [Chloroflexota bacterium]